MNVDRSLQTHEGEVVGHVQPFLVLTADDQVLEQAVTGEAFRRSRSPNLVEIVELDPYAIDQLLREFGGDSTGFHVRFIIRI